ncbi:hypothetical protein [Desulfotomaculum copahuensis]|uniref:hypothetical protein n=1 Tax=Desulfotomaculum copahuensis TaxID=1838280 RepID=UPI00098FD7BB|nr:hypothetical protein [Desulfotomaculum copahuensis]
MRIINYDNYIEHLRKKSLHVYTRWAAQTKAVRSRKPRDPEEDIALFLLDRKRWQQALASGRLEKVGPRRYRWYE